MWFIGVEVEQGTSAPPPKKNPGSAPVYAIPGKRICKLGHVTFNGHFARKNLNKKWHHFMIGANRRNCKQTCP